MNSSCALINVITKPTGGGAEFLVRGLHEYLLKHGQHSYLIFLDDDKQALRDGEIAFPYGIYSIKNIFLLRNYVKEMTLRHKRVIVHAHLTWAQLFTVIACVGLSAVLISTEHSTTNGRRSHPLFCFAERILYRSFQKIVCISDGVRQSLEIWLGRCFSKRLVTIPNGARQYPLVHRPVLVDRKANLVSIGSLTKTKNFHSVIKSIACLRDVVGNYSIVGAGGEEEVLRELIRQYKLCDIVDLVGWQENPQPWLENADVQLIPSLWEGFGLVAVEGMSTGLPVIASNVAGLRDVLPSDDKARILIDDPLSPAEWKNAIQRMIAHLQSNNAQDIGQIAHDRAKIFSFDSMCSTYLNLYMRTEA